MANFINACNAFHYAYEVVHYFKLPATQCNISSRLVGISLKTSVNAIHTELNMNEKYDEIIYMERHESEKHPRMPRLDRAAQFAPYSALSGYEDAVEETARLTDAKIELDEGEIEKINSALTRLIDAPSDTRVKLTFFRPDKKKSGGAYVTVTGEIGKIDRTNGELTLIGGMPISFDDILEIHEID
jgi:hypothetical protein